MIRARSTERLHLERPDEPHWPSFLAFYGSERARKLGWARTPQAAREFWALLHNHWETRGFGWFVLIERASRRPVGMCGPWAPLHLPEPELAWSLWDDGDEGRGIAFEAAHAAHACVFGDLGWTTIVSYINPSNHRSIALAERLEARLDPNAPQPENKDCLVYRHPAPEALA